MVMAPKTELDATILTSVRKVDIAHQTPFAPTPSGHSLVLANRGSGKSPRPLAVLFAQTLTNATRKTLVVLVRGVAIPLATILAHAFLATLALLAKILMNVPREDTTAQDKITAWICLPRSSASVLLASRVTLSALFKAELVAWT
jgi:hypothetical protein